MKSILLSLLMLGGLFVTAQAQERKIAATSAETNPLLVGQTTPNVELVNLDGKTVKLLDVLKEKPTVLVFFRGGWCPYCNAQLIDLRKALPMIEELGFQLIAISPDTFEKSGENLSKNQLNFKLLSDPKLDAITSFGLAYRAPSSYKATLKEYSANKNEDVIPIPTVYVVDKKGEIQFQYANTDFKKRISSTMLINVLKSL
jgi:peroxiredoxin